MLNANGERELVYVVTIDDIKPIEGRDRVECAVVGGWTSPHPENLKPISSRVLRRSGVLSLM